MSLVSTLPKRDEPATLADFEATPAVRYTDDPLNLSQSYVNFWNSWIPYKPQQIETIFAEQVTRGFSIEIIPLEMGVFHVGLTHPTYGYREQVYNLNYSHIAKSKIKLHEDEQGNGIGRDMTTRFTELDVAFGVRRFLFSAEMDAGGFVWAQRGHELDQGDSNKRLENQILSETLGAKISVLKGIVSNDTFDEAMGRARLNNADDPYHLTQIEGNLSNHISSDDFQAGGFLHDALYDKFRDNERTDKAAQKMAGVVDFCRKRQACLTVAKLALVGERWRGIADYESERQVERMQAFGGKFRFCEFRPAETKKAPTIDRSFFMSLTP